LLCRKYFNSDNLGKQITAILKTFEKAGITSRDMKPGHIAWDIAKEQGMSTDEAIQQTVTICAFLKALTPALSLYGLDT
jgi:hypothetical protein